METMGFVNLGNRMAVGRRTTRTYSVSRTFFVFLSLWRARCYVIFSPRRFISSFAAIAAKSPSNHLSGAAALPNMNSFVLFYMKPSA